MAKHLFLVGDTMDGIDLSSIVNSMVTQGPLVAFLFFLFIENRKAIKEKDDQISALNKELREIQDRSFDRVSGVVERYHTFASAIQGAIKG